MEPEVMADRSPAVLRLAAVLVAAGLGLQTLPALAQTGRSAGRPTVSVPNFKNTVTQQAWWWQGPVAEDLAAMLANELAAEGDLQVVERSNLKDVLSEQELTDLGIVRQSPNAAQRGQMTGARYIVLGTVSSYDSNVENTSSGSNFGLLGFGTKKQQVETKDYVAIDIRVVDSTTGEVVGRRTVEGRATSTAEAREQGGQPAAVGRRRPAAGPEHGPHRSGAHRRRRHLELRLQRSPVAAHPGGQGHPRRPDRRLRLRELPAGAPRELHGRLRRPGPATSSTYPRHTSTGVNRRQ